MLGCLLGRPELVGARLCGPRALWIADELRTMLLSLFHLDAKVAETLEIDLAPTLNLLNVDRSIKIDSVTIMSTEESTSKGPSRNNEGRENLPRERKSVLILPDEQSESTGATAENLPIHVGTYMYFDDPRWWDKAPEYVDVAPTVRVVSISSAITEVPCFENKTRRIRIKSTNADLSVRLLARAPLDFKNVHPRKGGPTERLKEPHSTWTLDRIQANRVTELALRSSKAVIYYGSEFAECAWSLVHLHKNRLDRAYVLLLKKEVIHG